MPARIGNYVQDLRLSKNFLRDIRCLRMLDLQGPQGILAVWYLWDCTAEHFPSTGRLEGMSAKDIHLACNASKENASFIGNLTECGFLGKEDDGTYYLPNWREEQPYVAKAEERSEAGRAAVEKRWAARDAKEAEQANKAHGYRAPSTSVIGEVYSNTNSNTNLKSPPTPPRGGGEGNAPVKDIVELYREVLPELPQPEELTERIGRDIEARWNAKPERQGLEWWRGFFAKVRERPILMGENGTWCASLGWLVNKSGMDKVLGGEYSTRADAERLADGGAAPKAKSYSLEEFEQMRAEERAAAEAAGYLDPDMP